jgi:hypothetical protein
MYDGGYYTIDTAIQYGIVGAFDDLMNHRNVAYSPHELQKIATSCQADKRLYPVMHKLVDMDLIKFDRSMFLNMIENGSSSEVDTCIESRPEVLKYPGILDCALKKGRTYTVSRLLQLGVNPNTVDFLTLKIEKTIGISIDVATLRCLIDHGLNPHNEHLHMHCIHNIDCMDFLMNEHDVDMTKMKLYSMKTYKELSEFIEKYPHRNEKIHGHMNYDILHHLCTVSAKSDIVLYVLRHVSPEDLRKNFTNILKYAHVRTVYDELFTRTNVPFPDYTIYGMNPPPPNGKYIKATWLRTLANRLKKAEQAESRAHLQAISAKIAIDHFVNEYSLPLHLAEKIGFMSFISKRSIHYYCDLSTLNSNTLR